MPLLAAPLEKFYAVHLSPHPSGIRRGGWAGRGVQASPQQLLHLNKKALGLRLLRGPKELGPGSWQESTGHLFIQSEAQAHQLLDRGCPRAVRGWLQIHVLQEQDFLSLAPPGR